MKTRLVLSSLSLLLALFVYFVPNQRFPNSADDWSYLLQARLFASGHLYASDPLYDKANPLQRYVGTNCVTDYQGRRFSKYPPGWPLLLSLGTAAGAEWLVGPLLGAVLVSLVLLDVERRVGREWVARAWLLITLCAFFTYTSQSFRSHTATMVCLFAAFLVYQSGRAQPNWRPSDDPGVRASIIDSTARPGAWPVLASGALVGYASLIRYVDWIPLALWITYDLLRRGRRSHMALFAAGFVLVASGNLLYDLLLSGNAFATPTALNGALSPHDHLVASWRGFVVTGVRLAAVFYAFPPVIALAMAWKRHERRADPGTFGRSDQPETVRIYVTLFLMSVVLYFFYVGAIGGPGPRYLASYFPFLVVATVAAWRRLHAADPARARRLWRNAIVAQVVFSIVFAAIETGRVYGRTDLARVIAGLAPGKKIVLMKTGPRGETWADSTRNPGVLASADVLWFGWGDGVGLDHLIERFPGRRVFVYEYPGVVHPWPSH